MENKITLNEEGRASVGHLTDQHSPTNFQLFPNYPNPFNAPTLIEFHLPYASQMHLEVFDIQGRKVATLANRKFAAGKYKVNWEPEGLVSGVYVSHLRANGFVETRKLVLLR